MFHQLRAKFFRQHIDLDITFENGVIAIRGDNEAGKTTLLEAIAYAMGGSDMLREPLADVVTWGQKESALKVVLDFGINGVDYRVSRSKSGAEIRTPEKIEATGQKEVTRYIERLIGCTMKTAVNLMLANQQKLRGTLEEDGAAIKLIEQLANFALIDQIIGLVQTKLPSGSTNLTEARVATLEAQVGVPVEDDTPPLVNALGVAQHNASLRETSYSLARDEYDLVQAPAVAAQARLDAEVAAHQRVSSAQKTLDCAKVALAAIQPKPGLSAEEIEELRRQAQDAQRFNRAVAAKRALDAIPVSDNEWEGDYDSLLVELRASNEAMTAHSATVSSIQVQLATLRAQRITETACGLCGKDLSAVPEVVQKNNALDIQIADLESAQRFAQAAHAEAKELHDAYQGVVNATAEAQRVYQQHHEFITLDHGFQPPRWTWTGPDLSQPVADATAALQQAERDASAYQRELGRLQQAQRSVGQAVLDLAVEDRALEAAQAAVGDARATLDAAAAATQALYAREQEFRDARQAVQAAQQALESGKALVRERQRARDALQAQLDGAKEELKTLRFNNELIAALRAARPEIADELWTIVGATVSQYFSEIRGKLSTFERSDSSFKVDGREIRGLSGSTLDALGLAIRMALTKTFLPNTRFLVVDEPAAAADENRETNMLGVIASSQFDQVLLVTHSDLADSFASQLIQL